MTNTKMDGRTEICVDCGKEFMYIPVIFNGREIMADRKRMCDPCQEIQQKKIDEETTLRHEAIKKQWADEKWQKL